MSSRSDISKSVPAATGSCRPGTLRALVFSSRSIRRAIVVLACSLTGTMHAAVASIDDQIADLLANAPAELLGFESSQISMQSEDLELYNVYHEHALRALWVTSDGPGRHARALYDVLTRAHEEGLDPEDYHVSILSRYWDVTGQADLARLDVLLTLSLIAWVNDVSVGRVHPRINNPDLFARAGDRRWDAVEVVQSYRGAMDPEKYLRELLPGHRHYQGLRNALGHYRELAEHGGWQSVPEGTTLHPEEQDVRIVAMRRRLAVTGEYTDSNMYSDVFDEQVEAAVRRFQELNGLSVDGVVGHQTIQVMNIPVSERIKLIEMNMERWRWMDHDLEDVYVLVDIAGFDLQGVVDGVVGVEMRVIVGKNHHESPIFSDHIKYIEFNPFWNLTPNIARHETVPKIRKDPDYLARTHIRVFDGWGEHSRELNPSAVDWNHVRNAGKFKFRQDPGPWNALGTMKFVFPNKYSVYLHDTPNHDLFSRSFRAFSHGCIRLSEPAKLAEFILALNDPAWDKDKIADVVSSKKRTIKSLRQPLAVHITYQTAWTDSSEQLHFAPDIYGRDEKLGRTLY